MAPPARRSRRSGQWALFAVGGVVFLVAVAAGYAWLTREQAAVAPPSPAGPLPPSADPRVVAAELVQLAPELTPASAQLLAEEAPNASGANLAEIGWLMVTRGFDHMERDDLRELGQLLEEVYATLPPGDHEWMGTYMRGLREGSLSNDDSTRGRGLLTQGVNALAPERRQRLQALVEKAIRAGVDARLRSEGRVREANQVAPTPTPAAPSNMGALSSPPPASAAPAITSAGSGGGSAAAASPSPSASPGASPEARGEGYWRAKMQAARARVARLKNQVAELEKAAGREATQGNDPKRRLEELARVRAELAEAERAIGQIEEEARAAGALPGWLRE